MLRLSGNILSSSSERAIESSEPHRSPLNQSGACRTSHRGQLAITPPPRSSAAPDAKHEAPIAACQPLRRGATSHASRRWRRWRQGGRPVSVRAVRALHTATLPSAAAAARSRPVRRLLGVPERGNDVSTCRCERLEPATEPHATRRRRRGGAGALYGCLGGPPALRSRRAAYGEERRWDGCGGVSTEARHARRRGGGPGCGLEPRRAAGRSMTWTVERSFVRIE